jgi:hypothetical protein
VTQDAADPQVTAAGIPSQTKRSTRSRRTHTST